MISHKISTSEEMYMVTISMMADKNPSKLVSITSLAEELNIQPVSANQMIKKMADEGWVDYQPYHGVILTEKGLEHARRIIWSRRLWEVFLVRELGISLSQAEIIACDLEHHISEDIAKRLDEYLGYPDFCYHGSPILRESTERSRLLDIFPLRDLKIGDAAKVVEIKSDLTTQRFLNNGGVKPGVWLSLIAVGSFDEYLIECTEDRIHVSEKIAAEIFLRKE